MLRDPAILEWKAVVYPPGVSNFGNWTPPPAREQVLAMFGGALPAGTELYPQRVTAQGGETFTLWWPLSTVSVVVGKDLSEHGISFYHPEVIPHRRMIASLDMGRGRWLGVLVDLRWCRFTKAGWYESGGRFLQLVQSPVKRAG